MEMVAASKMRKSQERMARGRPYSDHMKEVIGHVANASPEYRHGFMIEREVKGSDTLLSLRTRVCVVVLILIC